MVEFIQLVLYRLVQFPQGEKLLVPQSRQDPCGDDTNGAPSTNALSLGWQGRAGMMAVP